MQTSGWLQLGLFVLALALITKPMGLYFIRVLDCRRPHLARSSAFTPGAAHLSVIGVDSKEQDWKQYTFAMLLFSLVSCLFTYAHPATAALAAAQSARLGALESRPGLQYRRQLHDQHQLAELRRRIHDVLSLADGGAHLAQLRLCGLGIAIAAALVRGIARHSAKPSATSGWIWCGHLLPAASDLSGLCGLPGVAGHDPKLQTV